jgi:hypothetical protein
MCKAVIPNLADVVSHRSFCQRLILNGNPKELKEIPSKKFEFSVTLFILKKIIGAHK